MKITFTTESATTVCRLYSSHNMLAYSSGTDGGVPAEKALALVHARLRKYVGNYSPRLRKTLCTSVTVKRGAT